jgi:tetratricopeptide (TPR) repeat protein
MRFAVMLGLLLGAAAAAAGAEPAAGDVAVLSAELEKHPGDPALARALARAHLEHGDAGAAVDLLRGFGERQPEQRPALAQLLGRALYLQGELDEARRELEIALAHRPDDALAHLYLGLVLWRSGDPDGAARELRTAGEHDPGLLLGERPREPATLAGGHFTLMGGSGVEFDTNPLVEGEEGSTPSAGDDFRLVYHAGVGAQLVRTEASVVSASYRYDGSKHDELGELDMEAHGVGLGGAHAFGGGVFARLDGAAGFQRLDDDGYVDTQSLAPTLGYQLGEHGIVQLRGSAERRDFDDEPDAANASLERDGWRYGASLSHTVPLERWPGARLTTQLSYARTVTHAHTDPGGFGPAFDSDWIAADAAFSLPVGLGLRLETRLLLGYESFDEENSVQFAADVAAGDPTLRRIRRRDTVVDTSMSLRRPLTKSLEVELRVRDTRHGSNAGVYDYDRQIVGTYLRFQFDR